MFVILLALSLLTPSPIHGASASASATSHKRKVPGLDTEADVKMSDAGEDSDDKSKKQKRNSEGEAPASAAAASASASATAMEINSKEVAHKLPAPNREKRLLQLYGHYDFSSNSFNSQRRQEELGRALYALRTAIDDGENVDTAYDDGTTLLHWAVRGDHYEIIALLLHKGAYVHSNSHNGNITPLHCAVGGVLFNPDERDGPYGNYPPVYGLKESALSLFADRGFDFNRRDAEGLTPLLASLAYWGRPHHIRFLLGQGARATITANGHGALWTLFNCDRGYRRDRAGDFLEMTKLLVIAGADFQSPSPEGRSPLYDAWGLRNKTPAYGSTNKESLGKVISWLIGIGAKIAVPNNEIFSVRDLLYARGLNEDVFERLHVEIDANQEMDESAEKLHAAVWAVVPALCGTPLKKQPNFTHWNKVVTCGDLIHSYFLSHPLVEEGYRQRRQNEYLLRRCLTLCFNRRRKHGLRDLVPHIQRFAGTLLVEHYPEANAKRAHAAQVVPMEEGE